MIKVLAFKNGQEIKFATVQDKPGQDTVNIEQALIDAHNMFTAMGIEYDDVQVEFMRVKVDILALNMLFLTPSDIDLVSMERDNEAKGAILSAQAKESRSL